jgi:CRP/FNR family cyclic AMP-dependent transcriptional regulator
VLQKQDRIIYFNAPKKMADLTGFRVETVIRVIRNLHMTGKLTIKHGKIFYAECA